MKCDFEQIGEDHYKCKVCGLEIKIKIDGTLNKECFPKPGIIDKIVSVVKETVKWVGAGAPVTQQKNQEERQMICNACPEYDNGTCKRCGCNMNLKILMETSHCPIGKW